GQTSQRHLINLADFSQGIENILLVHLLELGKTKMSAENVLESPIRTNGCVNLGLSGIFCLVNFCQAGADSSAGDSQRFMPFHKRLTLPWVLTINVFEGLEFGVVRPHEGLLALVNTE